VNKARGYDNHRLQSKTDHAFYKVKHTVFLYNIVRYVKEELALTNNFDNLYYVHVPSVARFDSLSSRIMYSNTLSMVLIPLS
jgi:hypothetical protein